MKRSDYEAKSRRFWMDSVTPPMEAAWIPGWLEKYVANDVRAAEAAGVVWDPEEPKLADEISCGIGGGALLARVRNDQLTGVWFRLDRDGGAPFDARATTLEVVRRYNAWQALESIVSELPDEDLGSDPCRYDCKLYAIRRILRGGAS